MVKGSIKVCVLFVLFLLLIVNNARANPLDIYGFGSRASSMAQAHTTLAKDFSAVYYEVRPMVFIFSILIFLFSLSFCLSIPLPPFLIMQ